MMVHQRHVCCTRTGRAVLLRFALGLAVVAGPIGMAGPPSALGQPPAAGFATWKDVELSPQFKEVITSLKSGGPFTDAARDYVASVILPQFDKDENLPTLDEVRKKIRDRLLLTIGDDSSFNQASTFVRDRLSEVARDPKADLLRRVNAMMFIGEMTDKARAPWSPALEPLAAAARDTTLDPAVRIAAVVGLNNHLADMPRMTADQAAAIRATVAATLPSLLPGSTNAPPGDAGARSPVEAWLAARGFDMLPGVMNPVPREVASRLVAVIDDASWPFDSRVRAAVALGKTVGPESGVDPQAVVASIRGIAVAALDADRLAGQRLIELQSFAAGAGPPGSLPGVVPGTAEAGGGEVAKDGLSTAICRRAAWRLYSLGDAIVPDSKTGGLAALLDQGAESAQQIAVLLKEIGVAIDAEPFGNVLLRSLNELDPAGAKKRAAGDRKPDAPQQPTDAGPAAPGNDKPPAKPSDSPFGDSPF